MLEEFNIDLEVCIKKCIEEVYLINVEFRLEIECCFEVEKEFICVCKVVEDVNVSKIWFLVLVSYDVL